MQIVVLPETHRRLSHELAQVLVQRDQDELGRKPTRLERLETEAAARVDAARVIDRLIEALGLSQPQVLPGRVVV